jgi:phosphatidylglycerophosphatase A
VLRRLKFLAPGIRSVSAPGVDPAILAQALAREDLVAAADAADAEILWQPDGKVNSGTSNARTVAVVAAEIVSPPLPHLAVARPAQTYVPLRDWVNGWFPPGSALSKIFVPLLVSPAVGDRPTRVPLKGNREWIFTRDPVGAVEESGAGWKMALVSGFGCGFFPLMPATLACVTMTPVALALYLWGGWIALFSVSTLVFLLSTVASVALEKWAGRQLLADDPREFVLDEYAGLALTWMFLPPGAPWWAVIIGFFLFRIFDIFKWGVHWVEELPIPGKIVWDDVLAGLYAGVVLWAVCWFL